MECCGLECRTPPGFAAKNAGFVMCLSEISGNCGLGVWDFFLCQGKILLGMFAMMIP